VHAGNDPARADHYLELLVDSFGEFRREAGSALAAGNWEAARRSTHRLAGATMYCAATAAGKKAQQLEDALKTGQYSIAERLYRELDQELVRLEDVACEILRRPPRG